MMGGMSELVGTAELAGIEFLDAWRQQLRPVPGQVPPVAGFDPGDLPSSTPATPGAALEAAARATDVIADLATHVDADLDPLELSDLAQRVEQARRMIDAVGARVAAHVDRVTPMRSQGYFNATTFLKQRLQLSGPEAYRRVQVARLTATLDEWAAAEREGCVGVAQCELMARIAANPRVDPILLRRDAGMLLDDAIALPYVEFERNARTWEALADPEGDRAANERQRAARTIDLRPRPDGGWSITGSLPELDGCEFAEVFGWYCEAEWRLDWAEARERLGEQATTDALGRTDSQRRADALLAMARAAVSKSTSSGTQPRPTVNILIDDQTFTTSLEGDSPDPRRCRNVICRTQSGRRLHPDDAINAALIGHVRRVVYDASGTVIDLGRRSRLFRGSSREAAMLLLTTCVWVGCDRPVHWCDTDHSTSWKAHGATVPREGQPLCHGHNVLKEQGFEVFRDDHGHWHIIDPDGNDVR